MSLPNPAPQSDPASHITTRAIIVGLILTIVICYFATDTTYRLRASRVSLGHMPMSLWLPFLLIFLINPLLKKIRENWMLRPHELGLILCMGFIGSVFPTKKRRRTPDRRTRQPLLQSHAGKPLGGIYPRTHPTLGSTQQSRGRHHQFVGRTASTSLHTLSRLGCTALLVVHIFLRAIHRLFVHHRHLAQTMGRTRTHHLSPRAIARPDDSGYSVGTNRIFKKQIILDGIWHRIIHLILEYPAPLLAQPPNHTHWSHLPHAISFGHDFPHCKSNSTLSWRPLDISPTSKSCSPSGYSTYSRSSKSAH